MEYEQSDKTCSEFDNLEIHRDNENQITIHQTKSGCRLVINLKDEKFARWYYGCA